MHFKLFLISAATMVNAAHGTSGRNENLVNEPINLGTAADFAILAKAGITTEADSTITGDIAVSPIAATAMTGFGLFMDNSNVFSTSGQVSGRIYAPGYVGDTPSKLTTAVSDMLIAYNAAAAHPVTPIDPNPDHDDYSYINHNNGELGGKTLTAGVYEFGVEVTIEGGNLIFDAEDDSSSVFIIKTSKSVTQAGGTSVTLARGALAENIFWQVAETVKVGDDATGVEVAHMEGTLLVWTSVTFINGSSLNGRILAGTAVTLDNNVIDASNLSRRRGLRGLQVA